MEHCERCVIILEEKDKIDCNDSECECHSPHPHESWEEAFDENFELIDDMDWDRNLQEEVKSFIRTLLASQRTELAEILKEYRCGEHKKLLKLLQP